MKMVVVGGNSREVGKTAVVAGLIRALPHYGWTAIKLTQYGHGICAADGKDCGCAPEEHPFAVTEETDRSGESDTSRFLAAGARRALWARVRMGMLETVLPALRQAIAGEDAVILESNSILRFYQPTVYLTVLDPATRDFKESAREFLERADAVLIPEEGWSLFTRHLSLPWEGIALDLIRQKPNFPISASHYVTPEIAAFVEQRLVRVGTAVPILT
jgi:hypothetical protein